MLISVAMPTYKRLPQLKRSTEIDSVRFLCNVMVVVIHAWPCMYVSAQDAEYRIWNFICADFAQSILPTLFLVSGFLFFSGFDMNQFADKIKKRFGRLIVPLIAWNLVFVALYLLVGMVSARAYARVKEFELTSLDGILFKVLPFVSHPIDAPMWFVQALLALSMIAPLFWIAYKVGKWLGLALAVVVVILATHGMVPGVYVKWLPTYAIICFAVGGYVAMTGSHVAFLFARCRVGWIAMGILAMLSRSFARSFCDWGGGGLFNDFTFVLMAPFLLSMAPFIDRMFRNEFSRRLLLPTGFFVFASHIFFNSVFMHTIGVFCLKHQIGHPYGFLTIVALSTQCFVLFCSVALWHLLNHTVPGVLAVLDGRCGDKRWPRKRNVN